MNDATNDAVRIARWQRVKRLLDDALARPRGERAAYVAGVCGDDHALRREMVSLLAVEATDFMDEPAFVAAANALSAAREVDRIGSRVGEFRIVREIGRGGMGTVYLAERDDGEFRGQAAVKIVSRGRDTDLVLRRFRQERQILAGLEHPNIARLFNGGTTTDGLPYFVMEYIEGEPIDQYVARQSLSIADRLALFRQVCAAVSYAHQRLIVHRDIKPANILVTADGVPKLLDFGIAKLLDEQATGDTMTTLHAMTPAYASPEQRAGTPVTTLTDVYSLGVVLYRLLTDARPPLDGEFVRPSLAAPHAARALRGDVDNIVQMAMRAEPVRRYASPAQLSEDIRRHLVGRPVIARPDTFAYRASTFVKRNTLGVIAGTVAALVIVVATIGALWQARIAQQERRSADAQRAQAERRFGEVRQLATSFLFELDAQIANLPGATPARELLVRRALAALDGLARDARDDRTLLRDLAVAYVRIGDVQGKPYASNLGQTAAALASYRKASSIFEQLREGHLANRDLTQQLARAYQLTSGVQARTGDVDGAIATGRHAVALGDSLLQADSTSIANRALLAEILGWLGRALSQKNTVAYATEARAMYQRSLVLQDDLVRREPNQPMRRYAAGVASSYEGYALWQLGDLTGDTANYRAALHRLEVAHAINVAMGSAMPSNVNMRRASVDALREMALLRVKLGEGTQALHELDLSLPTNRALAETDVRNAEAQRDLAAVLHAYADAHLSLRRYEDAITYAHRAQAILLRLRAADTTSLDDAESLSQLGAVIGRAQRSRGDVDASLASFQAAQAEAQRLVRSMPTSDGPRRLLAAHDEQLGELDATLALRTTSTDERRRYDRARCVAIADAVTQWQQIELHAPLAPIDVPAASRMRTAATRCQL